MLRIALVFGTIAGLISIGSIVIGAFFGGWNSPATSQWLGYLIMILALSMVFFGVRRYRDRDLGGTIRFMPAFGMGLLIATVASVIYVLVWEVYLVATNYAFMQEYTAAVIAASETDGITGDALEAVKSEMEHARELYANPLYRTPITFLEIFPVGLMVSLVSAALLRNPAFARSQV